MIDLRKSKNSTDNNISDIKLTSQNLQSDINIILPEESNRIKDISKSNNNSIINEINNNKNKNSIKKNNVNNNITQLNIKQQLSISLLNKMQNTSDFSSEEKQKLKEIIQDIQNKNYFYTLSDLNDANKDLITFIDQNKEKITKPQIIQLPDSLNYDIEFYKIGKKCSGIKKRYAIIKDGKLFSSKKPLKELKNTDKKNLKEKTKYLEGAEIIQETIDNQSRDGGEWSNRNKKYRIRINYLEDKKKLIYSSFFMYFDDMKELNEANYAIFNISKKDNYRTVAKNNMNRLNKILLNGNKLYTILKILTVKHMEKNKKSSNIINNKSYKKSINNNITKEIITQKDDINIINTSIKEEQEPNIYTNKKLKKENNKNKFSDLIPLISNITSLNNESKNEILNKYFINENENDCFDLSQDIHINHYVMDNNFKLNDDMFRNKRYIMFDKNKPEILFKEDKNSYGDISLDENNIYEISNIIKNSNNNLHEEQENNLIILGPKIDNDKSINYKYKNNETSFSDPEIMNIKKKIINSQNSKTEKGINIQIFKSELDQKTINDLSQNIFNNSSLPEDLVFFYKIKLSSLKYIESPKFDSTNQKDNIYAIEYNNQYFIPMEYFNKNQEILIEQYFSINQDEQNNDKLNQIKIGCSKINLRKIKDKINKYEIINENNLPIMNSFIYINCIEEKIEGINLINNIEGKDYSIGNDSYIIKYINKDFIDQVKNNEEINDEIKNKYFDINFDSKNKNEFLFRPNETMTEDDFISEISPQVSQNDLQNILNNKKFNYLPYCEMFIDEETLYQSQNLSCLSEESKSYIINNYYQGQWIYKAPEIKVKLLSRNLGITKNTNKLSQKIYCANEEQIYPLDLLINENNNEKERIIPLSENEFNIFDFKELYNINLDNYQWKTSIKFKNESQMESFIKLLEIARYNINEKKKKENKNKNVFFKEQNINNDLSQEKNFIYNADDKNEKKDILMKEENGNCELGIEYIEFIHDFNLVNNPSLLEAKLYIENNDNQNRNQKLIPFKKNFQIDKKAFNNEKKLIDFKDKLLFNFDKNQINDLSYKLNIYFGTFEFFTPLDLKNILYNTNCNILELPLYKIDDQNKIYALIEITISEKEPNSELTFQERYEEYNNKYLRAPLLIIKEESEKENENTIINFQSKNNHIGLYEPNIFRRKILNMIHLNQKINIDINNLSEYDQRSLNNLYQLLFNECVLLPNENNFSYFQFSNIRRNNDAENLSNSYRKKIGLELLKIKRHNEFMKTFRKNKWELFLKKIYKEGDYKDPFEYFNSIQDKKILFNSQKEIDNLQNLMYVGVPSKSYRQVVYSLLLDLPSFFEKTRIIVYNKYKVEANSPQELYNFFSNQLFEDNVRMNIIFSLIDNDSNYISSIENSSLEEINTIKTIAKAFFIWSDLRIGLENKNDKYVYFIGLLSLTQKLFKYFQENYFVFWILIGLAKNITHFHQTNPLFSDEMNYINIYGLVTKLIMERHQKKIYDKFISLNIPPELFISRHLSTFFTDYFKDELMMRILDIIIFESSFQDSYSDNMQYLRILCSIPLTLFEFNEERILSCKSVSEIHSIINDLNLYTFAHNKFISRLGQNINKFYVVANFFERWFSNNQGREWDFKRGEIENLMKRHFLPVYTENRNYLYEISLKLKTNVQDIIDLFFDNLNKNLDSIKSIYSNENSNMNINEQNSFMGIGLQISKIKQIYNNENSDMNQYKLLISFSNIEEQIDQRYNQKELIVKFDPINNEIINIQDLFYKNQYPINQFPKFIHFSLYNKANNLTASFSYNILNYNLMKISKIILENKEEKNKLYLEFILFKFITKKLSTEDLILFDNIFSPPEYFHSKKIEEKLNSYTVSMNNFNKYIGELIKFQNNNRNALINGAGFDQNLLSIYQKMNNNPEKEDDYNQKRIRFNNINNKKNNNSIEIKLLNIIESCMQKDLSTIVINWLKDSNISIEEIFYGIILVDKSLISINDKLHALFSLGQLKDKFLFNVDEISLTKVKEMIYSLYKRFRIYFTKTDVERMIDFLLKDEKLLNIKYVFVHNKNDTMKINNIINEKHYYEANLNKAKKPFEIYFDEIGKEFNIYLNHLKNHYNLNIFSSEFISYIIMLILTKKGVNTYKQNYLDFITLVIEKENIIYKRNYNIIYSPSFKIQEVINHPYFIKPKDDSDILNRELCYEISNADLNNSYNKFNYINFNKFKEIFFNLPYLSDLFRVSFTYLNKDSNIPKKEFDSFKIYVGYEGYSQGVFYFPNSDSDDEIENEYEQILKYDMNIKIKISETIEEIIRKIVKKMNNDKFRLNNEEAVIIDCLKTFYKIECFIWYELDENNKGKYIQEKIGYFDNLYSCTALQKKSKAEIHIIFNNDIMTLNSNRRPVEKEDGYCKIYSSNNNDFSWKKCKIKKHNLSYAKLVSADYKSTPRILNKNDDVLIAYNI